MFIQAMYLFAVLINISSVVVKPLDLQQLSIILLLMSATLLIDDKKKW